MTTGFFRTAWIRLSALRYKQKSFIGGASITIVSNGASTVISGINSILIARALGAEQLGFLLLYTTGIVSLSLFVDILGIYYASAYLLAKGDDRFPLPTIRSTILAYGIILGSVIGVIFGFSPLRELIFPGFVDWRWGALLALGICGTAVLNQIRGLFLGNSNFLALGLINLGQVLLYAVLAVFFLYGLGLHMGLLVAGLQAVSILVCIILLVAYLAKRGLGRPSKGYFLACIHVGWRAAAVNWVSFLHTRIDQYIVNFILGPASLGLYGVAVTLGELFTRIPTMVGPVLFTLVASDRDQKGAAASTLKRSLITMGVITLVSIPLGIFTEPIVKLFYTDSYAGSVELLRLYLPAIIFLSGLVLVNNHLAGMGYPSILLISMGIGLVFNTALNFWLLPAMGIDAAPVISSITYGLQFIIVLLYLLKLTNKEHIKKELTA